MVLVLVGFRQFVYSLEAAEGSDFQKSQWCWRGPFLPGLGFKPCRLVLTHAIDKLIKTSSKARGKMKRCVSGESRTALGQQLLGAQSALFSADYWMTRHMYNDTLQQIQA